MCTFELNLMFFFYYFTLFLIHCVVLQQPANYHALYSLVVHVASECRQRSVAFWDIFVSGYFFCYGGLLPFKSNNSNRGSMTYIQPKAVFTLCDSRPSLLDRAIICQCKHSGARARPRVFSRARVFQQPALPEP